MDVTSWGVRDLFNAKYGINSFSLDRSISGLPRVKFERDARVIRVGRIGSLYHPDRFRNFLRALRECAAEQNRVVKIVRIGASAEMDKVAAGNPELFECLGEMEEQDAIPVLANCNFLYAMYPDGFRYPGFRRTSLPSKLSTYIQAQRPIFAHCPGDSNMAKIVSAYKVGRVCSANDSSVLKQKIKEVPEAQISREQFETLRDGLMGEGQVQQLRNALTQKDRS